VGLVSKLLGERLTGSIRGKLLALALLPLVIVFPLLVAVLAYVGGSSFDRLLITKVRSDLAVANGYFDRVRESVGRGVTGLADSARLEHAILAGSRRSSDELIALLKTEQQRLSLDFLHLLDGEGRVLATGGALPRQHPLDDWPVVQDAMRGKPRAEVEIFSEAHLEQIDPALKRRAHTPFVPTQGAAPTTRTAETRGMVIHAAAPVFDTGSDKRFVLVGGALLNKNLEFVDRINEIVYPEGSLPLGSQGTATLFLDDVRIATNVRLFEGERAIGTRVTQVVRNSVLGDGHTWLDSAFVVNEWYVSAYEAVLDSRGERVGMLYVGFLEKPFTRVKYIALGAVLHVFVVAMGGATFVSLRWARQIFRPIERMHTTMSAVEGGDESARVGTVVSRDELGELAAHLDRLLDRVHAQAEALREWGNALDHRVAERTQELAEALDSLRSAQRQLVTSEKLAAVGMLTAGVAHEINNPIAVIQGNIEVLAAILGEQAAPVKDEIRLVREQVERIRLIVTKLLQFARPAEFAGYLQEVDPGEVVRDSLVLVGHQMRKNDVTAIEKYLSKRRISINRGELQQVLINLITNALQAMPDGGFLRLGTEDWDEGETPRGVRITVVDSGPGIPPEVMEHIFNPFFTTKKSGGTGLGLWVSMGIIERYGGRVTVENLPKGGAGFSLWLLSEPPADLEQRIENSLKPISA
jgi:signal transduction histidine kinase